MPVLWLSDVDKNDIPIVGGKAANLGELLRVDVENTEELNRVSEEIRKMIRETRMPEDIEKEIRKAYKKLGNGKEVYVAVRSSATAEDLPDASFAGQQDTYLNVKGEEEVINKVKECWGSLREEVHN
ncbi:MAG: pyruvate, water dikinase [Archaeoglobaceae archaeon]|nr:pyruvate, water dikinase [Archaeoglobaceae archaeon]